MKAKPLVLTLFTKLSRPRVRAGVLQLTLGICLVISILCASIILIVYYGKLNFLNQVIESRLRDNATSGIQYGMAMQKSLAFNDPLIIDLFGEGSDTVTITHQPWGVFSLLKANATHGNFNHLKTALVAAQPSETGKAAIYSPDNNAPLYLVGKTYIIGTVYASERKFSTGYIDGKGFELEKLTKGDIKKSEPLIPELDTILLHEIKMVLHGQEDTAYKLNPLEQLPGDTVFSFIDPRTNYYFSSQSIDLEDSWQGNIIIHSAIKVRVAADALLQDVLILAPDIDIDAGFKGSVHCFATRSIHVGSDSKLQYPSSLVLVGGESDSTIVIRHNATVEGVVIIAGHDQAIGSKGVLKIEKDALFHGMAYINGGADIQGRLWGHITARSFQANVNGAIYGNHLINAEINGDKRSPDMPATLLWGNTNQLLVAKWLE